MDTRYELRRIANTIMTYCYHVENNGLAHGKLGMALFLFHNARLADKLSYRRFAEELLLGIQKLAHTLPMSLENGILGLVWTVNQLEKEGLIEPPTEGSVGNNPQIMQRVNDAVQAVYSQLQQEEEMENNVITAVRNYWHGILCGKTVALSNLQEREIKEFVDKVQTSLELDRLCLDGGLVGLGMMIMGKNKQ